MTTREDLFKGPEIPAEDKILFWMVKFKEANYALDQLERAAKVAIDAYQDRFESLDRDGRHVNYVGPIDEEMKALRSALSNTPK